VPFKAELNNKSIMISDEEVDLRFKFKNLSKKDVFAYKYYVKPKMTGISRTVTIVGSWGRSDVEQTSSIDVKDPNPIFDIIPRPKDISRIIGPIWNQPLDIVYDITYLGGSSEPELHNAKLSLERDSNYCNGSIEKNSPLMNFYIYKTEHIYANVKFTEIGKVPIPGIYINDKLYSFKDVTITTLLFTDYFVSIINPISIIMGLILAIGSFLILIAFGKKPEEYGKEINKRLFIIYKRIQRIVLKIRKKNKADCD